MPNDKFINPDTTASPVFILSDHHEKLRTQIHAHRRAQFMHVSAGTVSVITERARWVIPPQRAVWLAPYTAHRVESHAPFWLTTCYVEPELICLPEAAFAVSVDKLTNELLIEAASFGSDYPSNGAKARIINVLLDRLPNLSKTDIFLPEPMDKRIKRITDFLIENPSNNENLTLLAKRAAISERTAARLFVKDLGVSFGIWRQHLKLQTALELISMGKTVTQTAFEVGYSDVSSFISAFKGFFGSTPSKIFK